MSSQSETFANLSQWLTRAYYCSLLTTFANSLDPDQAWQDVDILKRNNKHLLLYNFK